MQEVQEWIDPSPEYLVEVGQPVDQEEVMPLQEQEE